MIASSDSNVLSILFQIKRIDNSCLCVKYMGVGQNPASSGVPVIYFYNTMLTEEMAKSIIVQLLGQSCIFTRSTELFLSTRSE